MGPKRKQIINNGAIINPINPRKMHAKHFQREKSLKKDSLF